MSSKLVALDLLLRALGIETRINTLTQRKRIQKAVYLAQAAGANLGYRYGWYLRGPYSTQLTRDYYQLTPAVDREANEKRLKEPLQELLAQIRPLLSPPSNLDIADAEWMELLASVHYLSSVRGADDEEVVKTLKEEKPGLAPYADAAFESLKHYNLN